MDRRIGRNSIEEFTCDPRGNLRRIIENGEPEVLMVDGQPVAVILDVRTYAKMLTSLDEADTVRAVMERFDSYDDNAALSPEEAFEMLEAQFPHLKGEGA